ncbi:MAG: LptE family protein [Rikenellaceae bacterium]
MKNRILLPFYIGIITLLTSCGFTVGYSLSGASIPPEAKTFSVAFFPNNAAMVAPILSSEFTNALKDIFSRRTALSQVSEGGDFAFEGEIVGYSSVTSSVTSGTTNDYGSLNRLTITVNVRFTNLLDEKASFRRSFSGFTDYDASLLLTEVEGELITEIVEQLVTDIFQAAASNW